MRNFIVEEADANYIWEKVQEKHLIYHQVLAPNGEFKMSQNEFQEFMKDVPAILMLDRNVFTLVLELCENGSLKNAAVTPEIGLIMIWAMMYGMEITPGYSIQEYATQKQSEVVAMQEIQKFFELMKNYSSMDWFALAQERINCIEPCSFSGMKAETNIKNAEGTLHYYMAYAAMVHLVRLYKNRTKTKLEKLIDFYEWVYDNIRTSAPIFVYAQLLLGNEKGITPPHGAGSDKIDKVIKGCENQAWDLTYLANWFKVSLNPAYQKTVFFASRDKVLGKLLPEILEYYAGDKSWLEGKLSKKEWNTIKALIEGKLQNRVMPEITAENMKLLIEKEIEQLTIEMGA